MMRLRLFTLVRKLLAACLLVLAGGMFAAPAQAGSGTAGDPFTSLAEAHAVPSSGRYFFNLGSGTFAADVDTSEGGGWVLVLQYVHGAGLNPSLSIRGAGANLPVTSTASLGADESGIPDRWGHAGNAAMNQFAGDIETRWFGQTSGHSRIVHFRTRTGANYFRTGIGNMEGLASNFIPMSGHSAFTPGTATEFYDDKGDYAFTNFPFYEPAARHWSVRGEGNDNIGGSGANGNRWEVDDFTNNASNATIHRVWVRAADPTVVTNTLDRGSGSLRDAMLLANGRTGPDTITFAIAGAGPHTITLASALPTLTDNGTVIDGTTQPGTQCRDLWLGNGHDLRINLRGGGFNGLQLNGANQTIRGLSLTSFDNAIITLAGSSAATIQCNYLGLLANGTNGNNARGVLVRGASARIGGLAAGEGNMISSNNIAGVVTEQGSADTSIQGNFIGTDIAGASARPNGTGINNFFGTATWRDITRNLISGNNGNAGIMLETDDRISPSDGQIRIQSNVIGFNRDLSALLLNDREAIRFDSASISNVLIGGAGTSEGNIIAADEHGILLIGVNNVTLHGNTIARSGGWPLGVNGASNVSIGGASAGQGNTIGGSTTSAAVVIFGNASGVTLLGNAIGQVAVNGETYVNQGHGIRLENASNVAIGNGTPAGRNVISRNRARAIVGNGALSNIAIDGNFIGTDASGNVAEENAQALSSGSRHAISLFNATLTNVTIRGNVIGGHDASLINLSTNSGDAVTIQGNNLGVGADGVSQIVSGSVDNLFDITGSGFYSNLLIGGAAAGEGNLIAFGERMGLRINTDGDNIQVIGNTIRNNTLAGLALVGTSRAAIIGNSIYDNGGRGIDLNNDGVTANDSGDGDSGPNDLLNFPQIGAITVIDGNTLQYNVTLDVPAAAEGYRIEFFASSAADPSGFGEGERFIGHVDVAHAGGAQSYTGTLTTLEPVSIGDVITATTSRRTAGGAWDITSEFSAVATAGGAAALSVATASELFEPPAGNPFFTPGNDVLLTATVTNGGTGSTDTDSIFVAIAVDQNTAFFNDITPLFGAVVGFESGTPSLTFTPATDLGFSDAASAPTSFAQCTYSPASGYDPQVRHVCLNPKGTLPNGAPQGQFTVRIRARIN